MNHQISTTTTTTPNGEDLPEDLILEIFSHLPPISLLRFKSISKSFHTLISNPDFLRGNTVYRYRRRLDPSPPPPGILMKLQDFPDHPIIPIFRRNTVHRFISRIELKRLQDFPEHSIIPIFRRLPGGLFYGFMIHGDGDEESDDDHQHYYYGYSSQLLQNLNDYQPEHDQPEGNEKVKFRLIDSCNGLLLYLNYAITYIRHRNLRRRKYILYQLYVCNPITKDFCIKLPTFEEEEQQAQFKILDYSSANIVFDPSISLTYKVVIWLACRYNYLPEKKEVEEEEHYRLYVYSSETRSWRLSHFGTSWKLSVSTIDYVLLNQFSYEFRAVLLEGVLYWSTLMPLTGGSLLNVSLCYDIEKDLVWTLKLPKMPVEYERRRLLYFGVCGGSLRLIEIYYNRNGKLDTFPSSFDVMELNHLQLQQQQQWTVKYHIDIGEDGYYANFIRKCSLSDVFILDLYKTTMKAGEGEEMLLCINDHRLVISLVISFNPSNNTFGKEMRNDDSLWYTNVLRYTITLFPLH